MNKSKAVFICADELADMAVALNRAGSMSA
jgi:hypothetical protein